MIADSVACLASAARFKDGFATLQDAEIKTRMDKFIVKSWHYKRDNLGDVFPESYYRERIGLIADDVMAIDRRLVSFDHHGQIRSIDYNGVISLTAARVAALSRDFDRLQAEFEMIKRAN